MTTYDFAQLMEKASAEGGISAGLLPDGPYVMEAATTNVGSSQGGKDQIGVRWKVLEGPAAGQAVWDNQTLSPENPKAMAAFFGWASGLGMDAAFFQRQPQPTLAEIASNIKGKVCRMKVGNRKWTGSDRVSNTFKVEEFLEGYVPVGGVPGMPPVPVAPQPAPAAAPTAPAPAPEAAPAAPQPGVTAAVDPNTGLPPRSF